MVIDEKEVKRIADALEEGGEYFECAGQVVYGWRVASYGENAPFEAAAMLMALLDEIKRLRGRHEIA